MDSYTSANVRYEQSVYLAYRQSTYLVAFASHTAHSACLVQCFEPRHCHPILVIILFMKLCASKNVHTRYRLDYICRRGKYSFVVRPKPAKAAATIHGGPCQPVPLSYSAPSVCPLLAASSTAQHNIIYCMWLSLSALVSKPVHFWPVRFVLMFFHLPFPSSHPVPYTIFHILYISTYI